MQVILIFVRNSSKVDGNLGYVDRSDRNIDRIELELLLFLTCWYHKIKELEQLPTCYDDLLWRNYYLVFLCNFLKHK